MDDDVFDPNTPANGFGSGCFMHRSRLIEPCNQDSFLYIPKLDRGRLNRISKTKYQNPKDDVGIPT